MHKDLPMAVIFLSAIKKMEDRIMKKVLSVFAFAALLFASCEKQQEIDVAQENETVGVPMTITASIAKDTKASYAEVGGIIKATWDASETMSVVTYKKDNSVSIDNFTYSGEAGRSSAAFTGTYTGGDTYWTRVCVYPALTETFDGTKKGSPANAEGFRAVYNSGSYYLYTDFMKASNAFVQSASGNFDHIAEGSLLIGAASIDGDNMTATLDQQLCVLKVNMVLPNDYDPSIGDTFTYAKVETKDSENAVKSCFWNGTSGYLGGSPIFTASSRTCELKMLLGASGIVPADRTVTVYFPFRADAFTSGDKFIFTLHDNTSGEDYTATKTLTSDFSFAMGSQYNMNVNLAGSSTPTPPAATNLSPSNQTSNCYVIPSSTVAMYKFKNCKGESYNYLNSTAESACVLWESGDDYSSTPSVGDIISSATLYSDGYVYIETTGARGNAVVAVKDDSDNILWSWHIWVTGDGFNPLTDIADDGTCYWMKVNLGALSYATTTTAEPASQDARYLTTGLLYQFGRKDPFRGIIQLDALLKADGTRYENVLNTTNSGDWSSVDCSESTGTVAYANAHPMTFINADNNNFAWNDWVYGPSEMAATDRWNSAGTDNPCPYGWDVASGVAYERVLASYSINQDPVVWAQLVGVGLISTVNSANIYFPFAGHITSDGFPQLDVVYKGSGYYTEWQNVGFYWARDGWQSGAGASRYCMVLRSKYLPMCDDLSDGLDLRTNLSLESYSVDNSDHMRYYSSSYAALMDLGLATGMSVRCVKAY